MAVLSFCRITISGMASSPTFSVILPTYNRGHLLGRAIESVLAQTYQNFELIVVDDASTDATKDVVESFRDGRIIYILLERNGGPSVTRNRGILRARGRYISFLDDDDEYLRGFLAETFRVFEAASEGVGFIGCGVQIVEDLPEGETFLCDQVPPIPRFANREEAYLSCLKYLPFGSSWGMTVRPACFDAIGLFDETLRTDVDRDLIIRLAHQFDFRVIPTPMVKRHWHPGPRVTTYGPVKAKAHERIIKKNIQALRQQPRLWALWHYKTGWLHYHSGNRDRGREFMVRGLRKHPWHLKSWAGLLIFEILGAQGPRVHSFMSRLVSAFRRVYTSPKPQHSEPERTRH